MISKDKYLYNSDPLIGQWNKMQNITNIQWQICMWFWTFLLLFLYTYVYITFCFEGFGSANTHHTWKRRTGTLMQAWEKYTLKQTENEWVGFTPTRCKSSLLVLEHWDSRSWLSTPK